MCYYRSSFNEQKDFSFLFFPLSIHHISVCFSLTWALVSFFLSKKSIGQVYFYRQSQLISIIFNDHWNYNGLRKHDLYLGFVLALTSLHHSVITLCELFVLTVSKKNALLFNDCVICLTIAVKIIVKSGLTRFKTATHYNENAGPSVAINWRLPLLKIFFSQPDR